MPAALKLFIDWTSKKLVKSDFNAEQIALPVFYQGDVVPFEIVIVQPDASGGPNDFTRIDNSNMALKMAMSDTPNGTSGSPVPFATQFTWSKNTTTFTFSGSLALNTAGLNTFLGSSAEKTAYFEIEITEDTYVTTVYQSPVTVKSEVIDAATTSVPAVKRQFHWRLLHPYLLKS